MNERREIARGDRGSLMIPLFLMVMVALLPAVISMMVGNARRIRTAGAIYDTRQFREMLRKGPQELGGILKEDFFADHFDPDFTSRIWGEPWFWEWTKANYDYKDEGETVVFSSAAAKMLYLRMVQENMEAKTDHRQKYHLNSVFTFRNDALRFGLVIENPLAVGPTSLLDGTTVTGGMFVRGDLDVGGGELTVTGRPVVVTGDVRGGPKLTVTAGTPLYHGGRLILAGATLMGPVHDQAPPVDVLGMDLGYYARNHWRIVAPVPPAVSTAPVWTLADDPATGVCRCYHDPADPTAFWELVRRPEGLGWPVLVVQDGHLTLRGKCSARLTVVSQSSLIGADYGNITIVGDVGQADGFTVSSSTRAFAALASNTIFFDTAADPQIDAGGYYRASRIDLNGNGTVTVRGTAHALLGMGSSGSARLTVQHDPNLFSHIPPRIPERPVLATFTSRD